jgi:hypothetical protein
LAEIKQREVASDAEVAAVYKRIGVKDMQVYKLFTCNAPHLFTPQKAEDNAALLRATVVKFGDPRFTVRWPRMFGQFFRFDKWNLCRG